MWEKSNSAGSGGFSITDLGVDDDLLENLIQKDASKPDGSYKMKN
jgi:hypothetical protein